MRSALLITIAALTTACTNETRNSTGDRNQLEAARAGWEFDERVLICATDPQSLGFETSRQCFDYAQTLFEAAQ